MKNFQDHFSNHSEDYARYRPTYPVELFRFLAELCPENHVAWDCATGNGQAAVKLAPFFPKVIATDASAAQISNAEKHANVEYRTVPAEASGIASASIDLITVAQAIHWFDTGRFYTEVKRVLKPSGIFTMWCYKFFEATPEIVETTQRFYFEVVYPYWPPERKILENLYRDVPFPFTRLETPAFYMAHHWNLNDLLGYVHTWSATQRFIKDNGTVPLQTLSEDLQAVWENPEEIKEFKWPIYLFAGKL